MACYYAQSVIASEADAYIACLRGIIPLVYSRTAAAAPTCYLAELAVTAVRLPSSYSKQA